MPFTAKQREQHRQRIARYRQRHPEVRQRAREAMRQKRQTIRSSRIEGINAKYAAIFAELDRRRKTANDPMLISPEYLAGFIDGEGSIGVQRNGGLRPLTIRVTIANCDADVLIRIRDQFGFGCLYRDKEQADKRARPITQLCFSPRQSLFVLEWVLPYLIVKRAQALLCIELIRLRDAPRADRFDGRNLRLEAVARESELATAIAALNRKGRRVRPI